MRSRRVSVPTVELLRSHVSRNFRQAVMPSILGLLVPCICLWGKCNSLPKHLERSPNIRSNLSENFSDFCGKVLSQFTLLR